MTNRELLKELKQVVTGEHGHEAVAIYKKGRSWVAETGFYQTCKQIADEENGLFFHHDRNSSSVAEIKAEFEYAWDFLRN